MEYYTADEAMQKLKKPRSTFFKEVEDGLIPFELEEGRQRGRRYPKQAVDVLAQRQSRTRNRDKGPTHLVFSPSTVADLWAEVQIGISLYGEDDIVPYEKLLEWRDTNDEIFMSVKDQGQVVAYANFMPLDESVILPLLHDKLRERDIPIRAIRQWTDPEISVYAASITVRPTGNQKTDTERGRFLIRNTLKWALAINRQSDVKNWYSIGATKEGQHILESLGFSEIISLYGGEHKGYLLKDLKQPKGLMNKLLKEMDERSIIPTSAKIGDANRPETAAERA